jgi:hypothetical protein
MKSFTALPYSPDAKFRIAANAVALLVLSSFIGPHSPSMLA